MADHLINTVAADGGYFNPDLAGQCAPGDTITIDSAHPLTYLYVGVLQGHADDPIIIRNKNGQAKVGKFDLTNCVGVKIDGSGDSTVKRGFLSTGDPNNQTAG